MTRETTPETQMRKLILETMAELPNTARVTSTLNMAYNMIDQLADERDRALEAGRLMTERLDAIRQLPRYSRNRDSWLYWRTLEPYVTPPTAEGTDALRVVITSVREHLETTARELRESAKVSDAIREELRAFIERGS